MGGGGGCRGAPEFSFDKTSTFCVRSTPRWLPKTLRNGFRSTKQTLLAAFDDYDRQASSESASERDEHNQKCLFGTNRIGPTGCNWFERPATHFDRLASSENASEQKGNAFGSTGVERERI